MTTDADVHQERDRDYNHGFEAIDGSVSDFDREMAVIWFAAAAKVLEGYRAFDHMVSCLDTGKVKLSERRVHWGTKQ